MRRHMFLTVVLGLIVGLAGSQLHVAAQDATPDIHPSGGVATEQTTFGYVDTVPSTPLSVDYYRITLPPGTKIAGPPGDPGLGLQIVESGTVTVTFDQDEPLTRDGQPNGILRKGEEAQLGPGEGFIWLPPAGGEVRNDSSEPAVVLSVLLFPQAGTPVAGVASTPTG